MSLSPVERLTLANQYRIMAKLYSESESTYSRWADELERGYESFYNDIFQDIEDPLPEEESKFVLDVLGMYQVLQNSATNLSQVDQQALATKGLAFPGFDGNDHTEVRYLGFVRHAVEKRNLFTGLKSDSSDYNSHFPTLNSYRVRLERWKNMMTRYLDFGPSTLCPAA